MVEWNGIDRRVEEPVLWEEMVELNGRTAGLRPALPIAGGSAFGGRLKPSRLAALG